VQAGRTPRSGGPCAGPPHRSQGSVAEQARERGSLASPRREAAPWARAGRGAPRARGARTRAPVPRPTTESSRRSRVAPAAWCERRPPDPGHVRVGAQARRRAVVRGVRAAGSRARAARRSPPQGRVKSRAPATRRRSTPPPRDFERHLRRGAPRVPRPASHRRRKIRAPRAPPRPPEPRPPASRQTRRRRPPMNARARATRTASAKPHDSGRAAALAKSIARATSAASTMCAPATHAATRRPSRAHGSPAVPLSP